MDQALSLHAPEQNSPGNHRRRTACTPRSEDARATSYDTGWFNSSAYAQQGIGTGRNNKITITNRQTEKTHNHNMKRYQNHKTTRSQHLKTARSEDLERTNCDDIGRDKEDCAWVHIFGRGHPYTFDVGSDADSPHRPFSTLSHSRKITAR